jgi:hypothetical protein
MAGCWTLPVCLLVAVVIGAHERRPVTAALTAGWAVVPFLAGVLTLPSVLVWHALAPAAGDRISDQRFALGLLTGAAVAAVAWPAGQRYGARLATRRRHRLTAYLSDPERG